MESKKSTASGAAGQQVPKGSTVQQKADLKNRLRNLTKRLKRTEELERQIATGVLAQPDNAQKEKVRQKSVVLEEIESLNLSLFPELETTLVDQPVVPVHNFLPTSTAQRKKIEEQNRIKNLKKKLVHIKELEKKFAPGKLSTPDNAQKEKMNQKDEIQKEIEYLERLHSQLGTTLDIVPSTAAVSFSRLFKK